MEDIREKPRKHRERKLKMLLYLSVWQMFSLNFILSYANQYTS